MSKPNLVGASIDVPGRRLTLNFDTQLDTSHSVADSAFTVTINGVATTINFFGMNPQQMVLGFTSSVQGGDTVAYSYTDPTTGDDHFALEGSDGADADSFYGSLIVPGPSVASIVRADAAVTPLATTTSLSYTVTFNEAVTGVDASDFTLAGGGTAGASISGISGSGSVYTVTVNGVHGDGALRLDLNGSGTGIVDGSSIGLSSGYSAGQSYTIDHTAPAAPAFAMRASSDTGTLSNDAVTSNTTPTFDGTAEANATVRLYEDSITLVGTVNADGSGHWNITSATLGEGPHTLTAFATDAAGNASAVSAGLAVRIDTTAPSIGFSDLALSSDTGISHTDFRTNTALQTVTATLSSTLSAGDVLWGSVDGGNTWSNITSKVSGTALAWDNVVLSASGTLELRVTDLAGNNGAATTQAYSVDTTPPATTIASIAFSHDSGLPNDFVTNVAAQTIDGTLSASLGADETVYVSIDDGATWQAASAALGGNTWQLAGQTLVGSDTLLVKVTDGVGNDGAVRAQSYVYQSSAPTTTFSALAFSSDTGSAGDFMTNTAAQTIRATLSGALASGDAVLASLDDGASWIDITSMVSGTALNWAGVTLPGSNTLLLMVTDLAGNNGPVTSQAYTLDTTPPAAPTALLLAAASDSGTPGDNATEVTTPVIEGSGEAGATVVLHDSDGVTVLGSAVVDGSGHWSIASTTLAEGNHALSATQTDSVGNVSVASAALTLDIVVAAPPPPPPLVDGVPVTTTSATLPGGGSGTLVTVPIVTAGEGGASGAANVADIPLVSAGGATVLLAQVPVGDGLTSLGGASRPAGSSLAALGAAIDARTATHPAGDQAHLGNDGAQAIGQLDPAAQLLVNTLQLHDDGVAADTPLTLTGTSSGAQHTALVVDASALTAGGSVVLHAVDFAAVIGAVTVTADTAGQIISGDQASQHIVVATSAASQVYAGGGDDLLQYAPAAASGAPAAVQAAALAAVPSLPVAELSAPTAVYLNGGTGNDTVTFAQAASAYTVDQRDGYVLVTDKADPAQAVTVVNVEHLAFADTTVDLASRVELTTIAGLYQSVLGRQAEIAGLDFWGAQQASGHMTMGEIALGFINSTEAATRGYGMNGDAAHDVTMLYQAIFNRAPEAAGLAFWTAALHQGATLAEVADSFVTAPEIVGHQVAASAWDLHF